MLEKRSIDVSFAEGLDTKSDPKRVKIGNFVRLENTVFQKGGLLQKRNGYQKLTSLPDTTYSYLTTFKDNLTAVGPNIAAYNDSGNTWVEKGHITPLSLGTLPVIRNNLNQTTCDVAIAPNGAACCVYLESDGSTTTNKYVVFDSVTGQNISAPAVIPVASGTVSGGMRVFVLGNNFVIVFTNTITATDHLQYVSVSIYDPTVVGANTDIAASYISAATLSWDGVVVGNQLFLAYNTTSGGQAVKVTYLTSTFTLVTAVSFATYKATMVSLCADVSNATSPAIYVSFYRSDTSLGYTLAVNTSLHTLMAPQSIIPSGTYLNLASAAQNGVVTVFAERSSTYAHGGGASNYVDVRTVTLATTTVSSVTVSIRSVGLASKAFIVSGVLYYLAAYSSSYQPGYFLINGSSSAASAPVVSAKLAYQNGGGYLAKGLSGVTEKDGVYYAGYLFKDLIQAANKNTAVPSGTQTAGIYSQTGVNLLGLTFGTSGLDSVEIGNDLHLGGGFLWMYDGYLPVEHNFFLYPEDLATATTTGAGGLTAQDYYYQAVYEWSDNQGNIFRSAPSIPINQTTTTGSSTNTIYVPTLRVTMKTANKVKITLYRWSTAQQNYFQVTSISQPTQNDTTADMVTITDAAADSAILGNNLLYTTGGVVEDIGAPGTDLLALFDSRLWLLDSEDRNLLWFSKQVIEATPVEMSDLFTVYVPPAVGKAVGDISSIFPMDDKLIISKGGDSFVYINGSGPDNTGANNQYSPATFITSTVGCQNQRSQVLIPQGMMFQSNKGIWLLGRDLSTNYIGAAVEDLTTGATVLSAVTVPGTNQVRFTLDTGVTLMYDYYYGQWGSFTGVSALSSCIWQDRHAFINSYGAAFQESPGYYLDGSTPVVMSFQTGPLRVSDLQAYQRAYFFYLLGTYYSPHRLQIGMLFDYETSPSQTVLITPINQSQPFGSGSLQSPFGQQELFGGPVNVEQWRVFLSKQRCMAFAIRFQEIFDASYGQAAGAGLTLSGLNVVLGFKKGFRPQNNATSVG